MNGTENVPCLKGRSPSAALAQRFGIPVLTLNDGLAAANAELQFGIGRRLSRFVVVTVGTGIGGGVVLDGVLQSGPAGLPPEIGAMVLDPRGERNYSGLPGTFEHLASAGAFPRNYRARAGQENVADPETAAAVFALAAAGDRAADAAIDDACRAMAQAFGSMINLLNLQGCVLGGGVAKAGEALLAPIRRHLPGFTWPYLLAGVELATAIHGGDSGWIGAAERAVGALAERGEGTPGGRKSATRVG